MLTLVPSNLSMKPSPRVLRPPGLLSASPFLGVAPALLRRAPGDPFPPPAAAVAAAAPPPTLKSSSAVPTGPGSEA